MPIDPEIKVAATTLFGKIQEKVKNFITKPRIPPLLSFFITKDGKINPTLEETLADAPPADENWIRMGLGVKVFKKADGTGGIPVWTILALPFVVMAVRYGSEALQFFIEIISQFVVLIPLLAIGYFIYRSFKK